MDLQKANPVALARADRVQDSITLGSVDFITTPEQIAAQAAVIIASRFHLSPVRARIVCDLAGIGRAAA